MREEGRGGEKALQFVARFDAKIAQLPPPMPDEVNSDHLKKVHQSEFLLGSSSSVLIRTHPSVQHHRPTDRCQRGRGRDRRDRMRRKEAFLISQVDRLQV